VPTQPLHALVQGAGSAWRITSSAFSQELKQSAALQGTLHRYMHVLMSQLAASAACIRFHPIDARLGRWLLMMHDRAHADSFWVTHEFMAFMLGVRRVGVTLAAGTLQRRGLIEYSRGRVTVLDRKKLAAATCSCYAADRQIYARIMH
jgi:CRP-like cAMP-binding protein